MPLSPVFSARLQPALPSKRDFNSRRWVYVPYDRLNGEAGPLATASPNDTGVIFVESTAKAERRPYHKKKLALLLANGRHFALELAARGFKVLYVGTNLPMGEALAQACGRHGITRVVTTRPAERELRQDLAPYAALLDEQPDPTWMTTRADFEASHPKGPPYLMERFYRRVRARTGILMNGKDPVGGKLSFDAVNRRPWRPNKGDPRPPTRPHTPPDDITLEVLDLVRTRFPNHFGTLDNFDLPTTAQDANAAWAFARKELLPHFGPFEDAMSASEPDLFHTRISPLLNLGRLLPARVVADVAADHAAGTLPLQSAEGFIRQILGWREFVRHVFEATDGFRTLEPSGAPNALDARRPLPAAYWGAPSGLHCLDTVVGDVIRNGFSHHITRLMVLGNLATLAGWSPRELTNWFWIAYIDAYDWVVEPNVLGMATYADGGLMTTKPYVSGAAYIDRMSDYCRGCRYDPTRSTGEGACPVTAMYWSFLHRNRARLAGNVRMAMPLKMLEKKDPTELSALLRYADETVERLGAGTAPKQV